MTTKAIEKKQKQDLETRQHGRDNFYVPAADIWENEDNIEMRLDLPGVTKENLEIHVERNTLIVHGKVQDLNPGQRVYTEFVPADYHREFTLSDDLDMEKIDAQLCDGVLRLTIAKAETVKPKRIEITAG